VSGGGPITMKLARQMLNHIVKQQILLYSQHSDIVAMCCTSNIIFCDICCFRSASFHNLATPRSCKNLTLHIDMFTHESKSTHTRNICFTRRSWHTDNYCQKS